MWAAARCVVKTVKVGIQRRGLRLNTVLAILA